MTVTDVGLSDEWLERARALGPVITEWRDEGERERRLPVAVLNAMLDAGLFSMWLPKQYGGYEVDPETAVRVVEEIGRHDGAAAWNLFIGGTGSIFAAYLPRAGAEAIFGSGDRPIIGGSFALTGRAVPVVGGHLLTGRWSFASGCQQAKWLVAGAIVMDGDKPKISTNGLPERLLFLLPSDQGKILDTWYTAGLRGTGSHDFEVNEVFIPEGREFAFDDLLKAPPTRYGPLYESSFVQLVIPPMAAVGLGIARDAIDSFKEMATRKTPRGGTSTLLGYHTVHEKVGRAEATLGAARAFLLDAVRRTASWSGGNESEWDALTAQVRLAGTYAAESSADVANMMFSAGGGVAVYTSSRLERCFRDANLVTHHIMVQPMNYEMVGQYFLGLGLQIRR